MNWWWEKQIDLYSFEERSWLEMRRNFIWVKKQDHSKFPLFCKIFQVRGRIYSQGWISLTSFGNFQGRVGTCRDHRMFSGQKYFCPGIKALRTILEDWLVRLLGLRLVEPAQAEGRKRNRALSNSPSQRRWTQATSGVAMAANATTNPSQLLPLGNCPVGSGDGELKLSVGGRGSAADG